MLGAGDVNKDLVKCKQEKGKLGTNMLTEGLAKLLLARADVVADSLSTTLKIASLELSRLPGQVEGAGYLANKKLPASKDHHRALGMVLL
ncbi:hypothetical protein T484DRAFT_1908979 [Baffinella frigidus]|nr:hypothetical protein T484DRAFT_1908979 [Cryptophyta sp. CCMP2293]